MTGVRSLLLTWNRTDSVQHARVRRYCREDWGMTPAFMLHRAREISQLPTVVWRGRTLYTIRCQGDFGKGPHDLNVPASLLWSLRSLQFFLCPYHR